MIEMDLILWSQFEKSGKIDDYLSYKLNELRAEDEQGNAVYNGRYSNS
jgi:lipopolysaccharide biosynthesis protein